MAQLSLYMDDSCMEELRSDAEAEGKSISAYAREVLETRHDSKRGWVNGWPPGYFEFLAMPPFSRIELPEDLPPKPIPALDTL